MKLSRFSFKSEAAWTLLIGLALLAVAGLGYLVLRLFGG